MTHQFPLDWAYAYGQPSVEALFRKTPEDFIVDEDLGFELSGEGEHVFLQLQKRGDNTPWLARQIAQLAGVESKDVGYAGMKDRHAVTRQWFSIYLPKGDEPDWQQLQTETIELLAVTRHRQKLRRGAHRANRFQIALYELSGDQLEQLPERLRAVADSGVPNYFGQQRFGRDGNNLLEAQRILVDGGRIKNRQQRGLILSAARSYLFNQVLSARVANDTWRTPMTGEVLLDDCPTGPLWGRGRLATSDECKALEDATLESMSGWRDGLEHVGLSQERRKLTLKPGDFQFAIEGDQLRVSFDLPPGCFATAVLREICLLKDASIEYGML